MGLLWPTTANSSPDIVVRLGRVAHWLGALVGLTLIAVGLAIMLLDRAAAEAVPIGIAFAIPGLIIFFLGRGVRYTLSAE
jgi:hypothetical protein